MARKRKTKAERKKGKAGTRAVPLAAMQQAVTASQPVAEAEEGEAVRPTPQAMRNGVYRLPEGLERNTRPALNMRADAIAALMEPIALLTAEQHDAARDWQEMRLALRAELGVSQGRSCLDIAASGYDSGDGDPDLAERWREVRTAMGLYRTRVMDRTCVDGLRPTDLVGLREALDCFAGIVTGRASSRKKVG